MPMQSRTDQVHSYQFFLQRVISGLVAKESDPAELPFRRLGWSAFGSFMVTILVAAGFGVYGIFVGGGATSWRDGNAVIVEKGSETPYIYRNDRLHPMVNVVSAQLALGGAPEVTRVSARSLEGVPRGVTLGIPGAPVGLPDGDRLLTGGWTLCSEQRPDGQGGRESVSALGVGSAQVGGEPAGDQAMLVRDAAGDESDLYLVWHGHRFELVDVAPALQALGTSQQRAIPVAPAWLDALPVGDRIATPRAGDLGEPTAALGDVENLLTGQVIEDDGGRHYLVRANDLQEITALQAAMVLADPATIEAAYPDEAADTRADVPPGELAAAQVQYLPDRTMTGPPDAQPEFASPAPDDLADAVLCAAFPPDEFIPEVRVGARLPWPTEGIRTPGQTEQGSLLADYLVVEGGAAALVQTIAAPGAPGGSWHIVTDQGLTYALPAPEVAGTFGYELDRRVRMPAGLLERLPTGPVLDPAAARLPVEPSPPA